MMAGLPRILYVEDDVDSAEMLQFALERKGFQVIACLTSDEGLKRAREGGFLAIVLDHRLADITGFEICGEIRKYDLQTTIMFYTASAYPQDKSAGLAAGANHYFVKPLDFEKIVETVVDLRPGQF